MSVSSSSDRPVQGRIVMNSSVVSFSKGKVPWRFLMVALAASVAAACQGDRLVTGSVPKSVAERHSFDVAPERVVLDLPADRGGLNQGERGAVRDFVAAYRQEGKGPLEVLGPSGSRNESSSQMVIGEVRKIARSGGVSSSALSYSAYRSKEAKPPVVLRYTRYHASAECGQWPSDLDKDWQNVPYENFGCATRRNLAAMVDDPRDLHHPRRMTPRDSERRDEIFDNYRRGRPTGARTSSDDAGTVGQ